MTELMKRYEAETGERATFVYIEKDSEGREKSTNITTGGFDVWVMGEAERLNEENAKLKDQLRWRPVSEGLPEKENPVYPKPWRNRIYKPYIVTDGYTARFALFTEVSKDRWWFVNPHNHHEIKNVVAWKDASLGLPIPPAPEGE